MKHVIEWGTEAHIPDVLIPHLAASLTMNWESPPHPIHDLCRYTTGTSQASLGLAQIKARCGEDSLKAIQHLAGMGGELTFERMREVQKHFVPEHQANFRRGIGYTSVRRERYAYFAALEGMFQTKVAADDQDNCHPLIKAVRLYLDIIFFHPFGDGNARAAMLWFSFYALRHNFNIPDFRKFNGFGFVPGNKACYWKFTHVAIQEVVRFETIDN